MPSGGNNDSSGGPSRAGGGADDGGGGGMLELDDLVLPRLLRRDDGPPPPPTSSSSSSFPDDHHRDYHSEDDSDSDSDIDDIDDGGGMMHERQSSPPRDDRRNRNRRRIRRRVAHLLGRAYDIENDNRDMIEMRKSLFWFTYRNDLVVPLRPYPTPTSSLAWNVLHHHRAITTSTTSATTTTTTGGGGGGGGGMRTDAGWGCMLRSAQMMMAEAVRRHYRHRFRRHRDDAPSSSSPGGHRRSREEEEEEEREEEERVARWFADFPNHASSSSFDDYDHDDHDDHHEGRYYRHHRHGDGGIDGHWYSLHQMVAAGIGLGVLPGEWYGPTTACRVLCELNGVHCRERMGLYYYAKEAGMIGKSGRRGRVEGEREGKGEGEEKRSGEVGENDTADDEDDVGDDDAHPTTTTSCDVFRVHVSTEGCVYLDAVRQLVTKTRGGGTSSSSSSSSKGGGSRAEKREEGSRRLEDDSHSHPHPPPSSSSSSLSRIERVTDDPLRSTTTTAKKTRGGDDDDDRDLDDNDDIGENSMDEDEWETSLLLLMPLRLGLKSINASDYGSTLSRLIALPHSVGMLGGTPRHALWFYGADAVDPPPARRRIGAAEGGEDDDDSVVDHQDGDGGWYGLDPHVVQPAPRGTRVLVGKRMSTTKDDGEDASGSDAALMTPDHRWQVQLTGPYLRSLHASSAVTHPNHERPISLSSLDPSCALGFYVRDRTDFACFRRSIELLSAEHCRPNGLPEIVTVAERTPNYELDVSSAISEMIGKGGAGDMSCIAEGLDGFSMQSDAAQEEDDNDDDDDFVLI